MRRKRKPRRRWRTRRRRRHQGAGLRAAQAGAPAAARAHLPRERVVYPSPAACPCCGGALHKLGEDVTETLELMPRQWKVIQHVREKFSCRTCESDHPAAGAVASDRARARRTRHCWRTSCSPSTGCICRSTARARAYAREGIELDVSTLADWVGASAATLMPLVEAIRAHVFAAERIHADDTTCRCWPRARPAPAGYGPMCATTGRSAAAIRRRRSSSTRPIAAAKHPGAASGELRRADAGGRLCGVQPALRPGRKPGPIIEAACWAHARRKFFDLARLDKAPIAIEAVKRIDALFAIEREINGIAPQERLRVRSEQSRPLVVALEAWLREQRAKLSGQSKIAKAIAYSLTRWPALTRFLDDGRLCMSNNAAEREIRPSQWAATTGPSPAPTKAATVPLQSTR